MSTRAAARPSSSGRPPTSCSPSTGSTRSRSATAPGAARTTAPPHRHPRPGRHQPLARRPRTRRARPTSPASAPRHVHSGPSAGPRDSGGPLERRRPARAHPHRRAPLPPRPPHRHAPHRGRPAPGPARAGHRHRPRRTPPAPTRGCSSTPRTGRADHDSSPNPASHCPKWTNGCAAAILEALRTTAWLPTRTGTVQPRHAQHGPRPRLSSRPSTTPSTASPPPSSTPGSRRSTSPGSPSPTSSSGSPGSTGRRHVVAPALRALAPIADVDRDAREALGALPVPLADGRTLPGPARHADRRHRPRLDADLNDRPSRRRAPAARTARRPARDAADLLDSTRDAVERSLDDAESGLDIDKLRDTVLTLVTEAGARPGEHPWLAALALPDDGRRAPPRRRARPARRPLPRPARRRHPARRAAPGRRRRVAAARPGRRPACSTGSRSSSTTSRAGPTTTSPTRRTGGTRSTSRPPG